MLIILNKKSQSLINQGNILTEIENEEEKKYLLKSQSLINQGNILTKMEEVYCEYFSDEVAIPYKSGKYSYFSM